MMPTIESSASKRAENDFAATVSQRSWWSFCLAIVLVKFILLALDPLPKFYMGDSMSYLWTAVSGWIPEDRSYCYGYVIRWIALSAGSLTPLLILQAFAGAVIAIVCGAICLYFLRLPARLAYAFGVLCAVDPLQLFWEHAVMTENLSLLFYALLVLYSLVYLRHQRLLYLVIIQILAVCAIGFRMSYLITVQAMAVILPLVAFWPPIESLRPAELLSSMRSLFAREYRLRVGLHLLVSVGVMLLLQDAYKRVNGLLSQREPAYLYGTGLHLLCFWAPALRSEDAYYPPLAKLIAEGDRFQIKELDARPGQRFSKGGLVDQLLQNQLTWAQANAIAKETALRALMRNPIAVAKIALGTYLEFWRWGAMRHYAKLDLGAGYFTPTEAKFVAEHFHEVVPQGDLNQERKSVSGRYYTKAWPYYFLILLSPFLLVVIIAMQKSGSPYLCLLFFHASILLGSTFLFSIFPIVRYLHPLSFLTILTLAAAANLVVSRRNSEAKA